MLNSITQHIGAQVSAWKPWRSERLTRRAADLVEDRIYDLTQLYGRGFLRARATGQSITRIDAEVENLIRKRVRIQVSPGTYFVARGGCQNMVTRKTYTFVVEPNSVRRIAIEAACINAGLPIPKENDRFYGVKSVSPDLSRFLEAAEDTRSMVVQCGVWALTDNMSGHDVKNRLFTQDRNGSRRQAVSDADVVEAKRILDRLQIRNRL